MRDFAKHVLALLTAPPVAPAASEAPAPRTSAIAAMVVARPREAFIRLPLAGGYMAWPDVGTRVLWTEETRERHGKVFRHGTIELSGRVTRVDAAKPSDVDIWAAPHGEKERRVGLGGLLVPAEDVPRFAARAQAVHDADLAQHLQTIAENDRGRALSTRAAPAGRTSTIAAMLLDKLNEDERSRSFTQMMMAALPGGSSTVAHAPNAPVRRTSNIAAMLLAPPRDSDRSRSFQKEERGSAAADAVTETALIATLLRDRARDLPDTTTGIKIASLLRACASTLERRPVYATQTALEARMVAVDHLRTVAAKTNGKPGEAIFLTAKAIDAGGHLSARQNKASSGVASPPPAVSVRAPSSAKPSPSSRSTVTRADAVPESDQAHRDRIAERLATYLVAMPTAEHVVLRDLAGDDATERAWVLDTLKELVRTGGLVLDARDSRRVYSLAPEPADELLPMQGLPSQGRTLAPRASFSARAASVLAAEPPVPARAVSVQGTASAQLDAQPIVLVSCSNTKLDTHGKPVPAAELYTSPLFVKSLAYARSITTEDRIRILSARHGVIPTSQRIATYDHAIDTMSERERDAWGERAHSALAASFGQTPANLVILAGAEYVKALRGLTNRFRQDALPWTITLPFGSRPGERLSLGERLRWLNQQAAGTAAPPAAGIVAGPAFVEETQREATPATQIDSMAALKRLPIGTRLRLIRNQQGPMDAARVLVEVKSRSIGLRISDPSDKRHGQVSWYTFEPGFQVESRPNGFAILQNGHVHVEYRFEAAVHPLAPNSLGTWQQQLAGAQATQAEAERRTLRKAMVESLSSARNGYRAAKRYLAEEEAGGPRVNAQTKAQAEDELTKARVRLADARAMAGAKSLRGLSQARLGRLIAQAEIDSNKDLAPFLIAAQQDAWGVASGQAGLFNHRGSTPGERGEPAPEGLLRGAEAAPSAPPKAPPSAKAPSVRAAPEPLPYVAPPPGLCRRGEDLYGDTSLLTFAGKIPGFEVRHMGFGEFELVTPAGNVDFDRMRGRDFPGQTGRSHLLYGPPPAIALLLRELNARGVEPTTATEGDLAVTAPAPLSTGRLAAPASAKASSARTPAAIGVVDAEVLRSQEGDGVSAEVAKAIDLEAKTASASSSAADDEESEDSYLRGPSTPRARAKARRRAAELVRIGAVGPIVLPPKARRQAEQDETEGDEPASRALSPVEHRTAAARRDANIKAMWLAADLETHPRALTDADRLILAAYSDWGGIGIKKALDKFPPGFDVPDARQLIHAYFTPPRVCAEIARLVQPLLPDLVSTDGRVHALEPAVGIGRFPLALSGRGFETVTWHCVEFSKLSYKMLHALRPDIDLYQGPFEGWVAANGGDFAGRLKLVISNPPYGQRSYATTEDPDRSYRYKRADHYFLRRGLDLLAPGGLGIYIIPSGFLTGMTQAAVDLRSEVLRRHHLSAAFRLPNEVFSLANVVTDILIFRARDTILAEVDEADRFLVEGRYYQEFPAHILGTVVPNETPKSGEAAKRGWHTSAEGYTVVGEFTALPPVLEERPICASCSHATAPSQSAEPPKLVGPSKATPAQHLIDNDERMAGVSSLGRRVEGFLASVANPDLEPVGWEELRHDLLAWANVNGAPALDAEVLALAKAERGSLGKGPPGGAGWLLKAFLGKSATLIPSLAERPTWMPRFSGNRNDPLQWGEYLYRSRKSLTIDDLPGKDPNALFAAGWSEDSLAPAWTERLDARGQLVPPDEYLFGELWPKFDRAQARAAIGDAQAAAQAKQLIELIQPATFDEIEVTPQDGFVPLDLLAAWLATKNHGDPVELLRDKGLTLLANVPYEDHNKGLGGLSQEALLILGWVNHDYVVFQPQAAEGEKVDDIRLEYAKEWTESFRGWLDADPERQRIVEQRYQRARQGYRAHAYGAEPLKLARWAPSIVLNPHQIAGARRLDANRGGGLGFDVGVGKTYTILAALALARQSGRARRAVIVVPQPIAFQWVDNIGKALPDFRVVVIGINKKTLASGLRRGLETSETDSPEERSRKWARFQGGEFDVAILTYDSLPRTQMDQASTLHFLAGVTAIEREVELKRRNAVKARKGTLKKYEEEKGKLDKKLAKALEAAEFKRQHGYSRKNAGDPDALRARLVELETKHKKTLTERQDAVLVESVGEWLAQMLELPASWKHDPDIIWNTIAVDWLAFDEGHNGKNLHMPSSREGGSVPKFMGNEGEGSKRAWHWFFRCCDVQSRGGEVVVATATPASNSPVEFYNLVKLMDKDAWNKIGINDPEAFIDRFCLLEPQEVLNSEMETETRLACVGFKNLDELRSVIMKHWEFKTAKQAKLKLPVAKVDRVFVDMDADQEVKYQQYIKEIEDALSKPKEGSHKILGLLAKMAMVAMHSQLDEKFDWKTAGLVSSPESPKFLALAAKILAQRGCGHIIFADYIAAHVWIRDVLVDAGIPVERIGILNAVVAPSAADRQRIAREFNGDRRAGVAPRFDILIANMVGEEGVDLQERTCAIHHMDIGWTPKKTEQRNGRGVRQGNTLSNINIFYYIANRSQDGSRLDMVRGKQNWISSLLEGEAKDTNNPAAQSTLSRKELLVLISRDPEKTRLRLEAAEAEREEERKVKVAKAASDSLRALVNRFERARTEQNPTIAAEFQSVARQKLAGLAKVPPDIWPWATWAAEAEQHSMLVPKEGGPVYEGLRVAMPRLLDRSVVEYAEFGRINSAGLDLSIGTRVAGSAQWDFATLEKVVALHLEPGMRVAEGSGGPSWPADDQAGIDTAMTAKWLPRLRSGSGSIGAWEALNWTQAPDRFVEEQWAHWGEEIVRAMASTGSWAAKLQVPAIRNGQLVFGLTPSTSSVLPPTAAGWQRFLEMAPLSGEKFTVLEEVGWWWFNRGIPRNLLAATRVEAPPISRAAGRAA